MRSSVYVFDAAVLSLFAVAGAVKAIDFGLGPVPATLLGMLTGIGGGIVRDILTAEAPAVLRGDIYAVAALAGAAVVVVGRILQLPATPLALAGAGLCFTLRYLAIRRGWQLPKGWHANEAGSGSQ